jgi:hypothetical protein
MCARALAPERGFMGGTGLAFLLKVLRYANPPFPPLRWSSQRGTYDSMGAKGQVSPCDQTPDGGY